MRSPRIVGAAGVLVAGVVFTLSGCQVTDATCTAGLSAEFDLTVSPSAGTEPSVQYCAFGHCTPKPAFGPIKHVLRNPADEHAAVVTHVGHGKWQIRPRSTGADPTNATIRLYRDGDLTATRTVHLSWPKQDPCSATNPPNPHPTIRS